MRSGSAEYASSFDKAVTMNELMLALTPEMERRLENVSAKTGQSLDECAQQAIHEFLDHWEDYFHTIDLLQKNEERPIFACRQRLAIGSSSKAVSFVIFVDSWLTARKRWVYFRPLAADPKGSVVSRLCEW